MPIVILFCCMVSHSLESSSLVPQTPIRFSMLRAETFFFCIHKVMVNATVVDPSLICGQMLLTTRLNLLGSVVYTIAKAKCFSKC